MELKEKNRTLEMNKLPPQRSSAMDINLSNQEDQVKHKLQDLAHKLRMEEAARASAERRASTAEEQLQQRLQETDQLRKKLPGLEADRLEEELRMRHLTEEVNR